MKIKIRTKGFHLFLPAPVGMAGFVIKWIPNRLFEQWQANIPEPYNCLVTKKNISLLVSECLDALKMHKGLELIHVEAADGTFVSVKL